jgi:hypothetical protein
MPRAREEKPQEPKCHGGRSFDCRRDEHDQGTKLFCERCKIYLGCSRCANRRADLICLVCDNWANPTALRKHGRMIRDKELASEYWKIVNMRMSGALTQEESDRSFLDLASAFGPTE